MKKRIIIPIIITAITAVGWLVSTKGPTFLISKIFPQMGFDPAKIEGLKNLKDILPTDAGGMNMEFLKKIQELSGQNISPQDLENLKKFQGQNSNIPPSAMGNPVTGEKTLSAEDIKELNEIMEAEYKKISPEELEYIKKMQEQEQFESATPPVIPGDSSGMGM
jgi:hypothetical protein